MKKIKSLLILSAVLVLLVMVYLVVSPMWSEDGTGDTTTAQPEHTVAVIDHNTLKGFELTKKGETLSFSLKEDLTGWVWSENADVPLDNVAFASAVTALAEATSNYKLENVTAEDLAKYGLDAPSYVLKLNFEDGSERTYSVGNLNSFNSLYYFSEASAPNTVYMVDESVSAALELDIYDFVLEETPPVITEAKIKASGIWTDGGVINSFFYYPSGNSADYTDKYNWYYGISYVAMSSLPRQFALNSGLADALTSLITNLSFDECVGLDCTDVKYGFSDSRKIIIKYNVDENENGVLSEKEYVIYIGAQTEDGDIYAHTENSKLVYILSDSDEWINLINGDDKDFAATEIWLPNYEKFESMTFKSGDVTLSVGSKTTDEKTVFVSGDHDSEKLAELMAALEAIKVTSHTSVLEENTALEKKQLFTLELSFTDAEKAAETMTVETYTENYCRVTFMNDGGRLITTEDAEKIVALIADITKKAE